MLKGGDGRITTDIYHKPTYSFNYITFDSGHPRHTKVNIPFNMERRIRTIVSDEERSKQKLEDLKAILESKNYPKKLVEDGIRRAKNISQEDLRKQNHQKKTTTSILLVSQPIIPTIQTSYLQSKTLHLY